MRCVYVRRYCARCSLTPLCVCLRCVCKVPRSSRCCLLFMVLPDARLVLMACPCVWRAPVATRTFIGIHIDDWGAGLTLRPLPSCGLPHSNALPVHAPRRRGRPPVGGRPVLGCRWQPGRPAWRVWGGRASMSAVR